MQLNILTTIVIRLAYVITYMYGIIDAGNIHWAIAYMGWWSLNGPPIMGSRMISYGILRIILQHVVT